jgi:nascent polypeptide-associated complex subunit alpha
MFGGLGGMDPRRMQAMMKQMGIQTEEMDVKKIIFELEDKKLVFENPQVTKTTIKGMETYQVMGESTEESAKQELSENDIKLVMEKAGVTKDKAKKALEKANGNVAEAIMELKK